MAEILKDRVAIVTGSGRGQGLAAARLFAAEGAAVVINDLDEESVDFAVKEIEDGGGRAAPAVGDVSNSADVQRIVGIATSEYGGLDVLYNNAGIGESARRRFGIETMVDVVSCTEEDWRRIIDINLGGVFLFCKYAIPLLAERGGGSVINTASVAALGGGPAAYTAAKGGVISLTRAISKTYASKGIRANTICPGLIDTDMMRDLLAIDHVREVALPGIPLGRFGRAEEVASVALFLASDASSYMTGQVLVVDGGMVPR